jgi:hypothetical protein
MANQDIAADPLFSDSLVRTGEVDSASISLVSNLNAALTADIASVAQIEGAASILEVVCRTTGMGFAAVARMTEDRWVACAVRDEIAFGLLPGGGLNIKTTICDEIRANGRAVIIDHVAEDESCRGHHTPAMYGFLPTEMQCMGLSTCRPANATAAHFGH